MTLLKDIHSMKTLRKPWSMNYSKKRKIWNKNC